MYTYTYTSLLSSPSPSFSLSVPHHPLVPLPPKLPPGSHPTPPSIVSRKEVSFQDGMKVDQTSPTTLSPSTTTILGPASGSGQGLDLGGGRAGNGKVGMM